MGQSSTGVPWHSAPVTAIPHDHEDLRRDLAKLVTGARASTDTAERVAYARDLWPRMQLVARSGTVAPNPPAVIAWAESTAEVAAVVNYAAERHIPLVPYGAGSGVCGGIKPTSHSIVLDMKRMRKIHEINGEQLTVRAEAGILGQHLEDALLARGFTLGHYPSSIGCSTLGGWVAGRSAGQVSGRYGKIEDMILSMTCVDGSGNVLRAVRDGENSALIPLITGSEGILAVVTEVELQISPAPEARVFRSYTFPTTRDGLFAIREMYQAGLRPAATRLYDPFDTFIGGKKSDKESAPKKAAGDTAPGNTQPGFGTRMLVKALGSPGGLNKLIHALPERALGGAMLILMWEDDGRIGEAEAAEAAHIARRFGGKDSGEGPAQKWLRHRHSVSYRQSPIFAGGGFADTMEISAPWSKLWAVHEAVRAAVAPHAFVMAHFSHAYPDGGSIYFTFAGSGKDDAECLTRYDNTWRGALEAVVHAGGCLSHHHGVGRSKAPFMRKDQGAAVDVVRAMKTLLDPANILNPGTLIPDEGDAVGSAVPSDTSEGKGGILGLDRDSLLVHASATMGLRALETELAGHDLTLGLPALPDVTVGAWLEAGCAGGRDPGVDPVAQTVAGLTAVLPSGAPLVIKPAPRRAVGPDLIGAFVGGGGALGTLLTVHLVMRPLADRETLAYLFPDLRAAQDAKSWLRGSGVRPDTLTLHREAEGVALRVILAGQESRRRAHAAVTGDIARRHRGVPVALTELSRDEAKAPVPVTPFVTELGTHLASSRR